MKANKNKAKLDVKAFDTEELLERLADSPCARRHVPSSQSLEAYLRESSRSEPKAGNRDSKDRN